MVDAFDFSWVWKRGFPSCFFKADGRRQMAEGGRRAKILISLKGSLISPSFRPREEEVV